MWCDTFDADLLAVVPAATEALGDAAGLELLTHGHATDGKLNHPSVWNGDGGMLAFFWTPGCEHLGRPGRLGYWTDEPVIGCTFTEAVRDAWSHTYVIVINNVPCWNPPWRPFERLMYDVRGWTVLPDSAREEIRESVCRSLRAAAERAHRASLLVPDGPASLRAGTGRAGSAQGDSAPRESDPS
jgi:hypothetical protein